MKTQLNYGALAFAFCMFFQSISLAFVEVPNGELSVEEKMFFNPYLGNEIDNTDEDNLITKVVELPEFPILPEGGPDQPEVQSFTPIGTSDMVDPFSGDFSYNIPLMDVDGYPINIAYSAGVTMDQEASWVGLGWNLNPGVVNRAMRGLPDDFNGTEKVEKELNLKDNFTIGVTTAANIELFGVDDGVIQGLSISPSLGVTYNNYNGLGANIGLGINFSTDLGKNSNTKLSSGLGFSGSNTSGATISPSIGLTRSKVDDDYMEINNKLSLASPLNTRSGLGNVSVSYTRTKDKQVNCKRTLKDADGNTLNSSKKSLPISSSFNFGQSTYTPSINMPLNSAGGTFSFKFGADLLGFDGTLSLSGSYNESWLKEKYKQQPAYGYLHLGNTGGKDDLMLDFNRENDGAFTKNTPALPIPNITYDIFSVSGQGVAGSYRPVRKDIGHVYDAKVRTSSVNGSLGLEAGLGATFKGGVDIAGSYSNSKSGDWTGNSNDAANVFQFKNKGVYFREANELAVNPDPSHFNKIGGSTPVRFDLKSHRKLTKNLENTNNALVSSDTDYSRIKSEKRNQLTYTLTVKELKQGLGIESLHTQSFAQNTTAYDHHIGQFTVLNTEGSRYIYGIGAFSHYEKNVSFAVGATNGSSVNLINYQSNQVSYSDNDNSVNNSRGIDNYYNSVKTPGYAHSFLLTSLLNADYVDADNIKGPSKGDLGGYLKFSYQKFDDYKWRTPIQPNKASYDEGLHTDNTDDKGHILYGEKEVWYVNSIKSKNHIAIFYTSDRNDALSVIDENGGLDASGTRMQKLDKVELYALPSYEADSDNAVPLKTVHFEYDYSLCSNYAGNINGGGKLTLKKVYFTYQGSDKGRYSPYVFEYGHNPDYDLRSVDRWNCYKQNPAGVSGDIANSPLKTSDFPYVGFDKVKTDLDVSSWNMSRINLPSGGRIEVSYESDDYGYVQHKRASQMLKIVGVEGSSVTGSAVPLSTDGSRNRKVYFELVPNENGGYYTDLSEYVSEGEMVYFRALMNIAKNGGGPHDFVPGYAEVESVSLETFNGNSVGAIKFKGTTLKDNGDSDYNPIAVAAIQFGRLQLSRFMPPNDTASINEGADLTGLGKALAGALLSYGEIFKGPNKAIYNKAVGTHVVPNKSWLRLRSPNRTKLGGGHRVKEIRMYDAWDEMTSSGEEYFYGQQYEYKDASGLSSGVASYEPQVGGDENSFRKPIANNTKNILAPDIRNYQEEPFGEQFFPSASIGYSRVTINDIKRTGVKRNATGKVVHEFYTAKDFPTIAKRTSVELKRLKFPIYAIFFNSMIDELAASQGFVIENNDMHGKPKSQMVYAEDKTDPLTSVVYDYQSEPLYIDGIVARKLKNEVKSITKSGTVVESTVGLNYEAVADFRKSTSNSFGGSVNFNTNFTLPFVLVPTIMGSGSYERTAFRSATFTKVIDRFGIQEQTTAKDLGSEVKTKNLAYDAETGTVLLTQTQTNFNDDVYSFTYPAHWYYDQMGHAYKTIESSNGGLVFVEGVTTQVNNSRYTRGDEVAVYKRTSLHSPYAFVDKAWVVEANATGVQVLFKDGTPVSGSNHLIKVLRSGRRNIQTTPVGSIALRTNPLNNLQSNVFEDVLQAGAVEYSDEWRTFCECFLDPSSSNLTTNPYVLGTRGTWRPVASYVHLSNRTQTDDNGNSNIREDGMFGSFRPYYKNVDGVWIKDAQDWTFTSSVTEFSPFGQALETVDALERYSSSMFGYNQTLPIAVAANTRYSQLGYDGFEDYDYVNCSDDHFKVGSLDNITDEDAHTGRKSIKVVAGNPVVLSTVFEESCEDDRFMSYEESSRIEDGINVKTITIGGGYPGYQMSFELISGSIQGAEINSSGDGFDIYEYPSTGYTLKLTVMDMNGQQKIIEITK